LQDGDHFQQRVHLNNLLALGWHKREYSKEQESIIFIVLIAAPTALAIHWRTTGSMLSLVVHGWHKRKHLSRKAQRYSQPLELQLRILQAHERQQSGLMRTLAHAQRKQH